MKKCNGVQCGFCTPGIVCLHNLFLNHKSASKDKIEQYLQEICVDVQVIVQL